MKNATYDKTLPGVDLFEVYIKHQIIFKEGIKDVDELLLQMFPVIF